MVERAPIVSVANKGVAAVWASAPIVDGALRLEFVLDDLFPLIAAMVLSVEKPKRIGVLKVIYKRASGVSAKC